MAGQENLNYRAEIDGLRALAVIAVVINHFNEYALPGGFLGVDIFFVISGYVITASLIRKRPENGFHFLKDFYVRRIKRLYPALISVVALTALFSCLFTNQPKEILWTAQSSLFGISNLYLFAQSTDYFAVSTQLNTLAHTWSLGIEEQFYFIYPGIVIGCIIWAKKSKSSGESLLLLVMSGVFILSFLAQTYTIAVDHSAAYYLPQFRVWELSAGVITFLLIKKLQVSKQNMNILSTCSAAILIMTFFSNNESQVWSRPVSIICTAMIIAFVQREQLLYRWLINPVAIRIGLISYEIYLWHWSVISLSEWTIGIHWWSIPFQILLILALSYGCYRFINNPLRYASWADWSPVQRNALLCSASTLLALPTLLLRGSDAVYLGNLLGTPAENHQAEEALQPGMPDPFNPQCPIHRNYTPQLIKQCLPHQRSPSRRVFIFGDSHAGKYSWAVRRLFRNADVYRFTLGSGCILGPLPMRSYGRGSKVGCHSYVEDVLKYLKEHAKQGDTVFIGQRLFESDPRRFTSTYFDFIENVSIMLGKKNIPLVLLDAPLPPQREPEQCRPLPWRPFGLEAGCTLSLKEVRESFSQFDQRAKHATTRSSSLFYTPLRTGLCTGDECGSYTANGIPIWTDRGHISKEVSLRLEPLLRQRLSTQKFNDRYPKSSY